MKRFGRALAVTLGLAVVGSVVSLVPQKNATATGGAPVTVINTPTNPVPITGSVNATVSGTISAQQSGNWNVGLSGTPTVQFANTTPLFVKNVDEPGRVPYNQTVEIAEGNSGCNAFFCDSTFTFPAVPANKRLVIQHASFQVTAFAGGVAEALLGPGTPSGFGFFGHVLPVTNQFTFSNIDHWITSQQVTFYVEPSQQPTIDVFVDTGHSSSGDTICAVISGYLVSLP